MTQDDRVDDLLRRCVAARDAGADFPTVWHDILRSDPLVVSVPVQRIDGGRPIFEVRLLTGQRLVYGEGAYTVR